jgi:para-nitrobenzyl esterase
MEQVVETSGGKFRGSWETSAESGQSVLVFRGIPYAASPMGPLRFRPPESPAPFSGIRDAVTFGPAAMQSKSSLLGQGIPGDSVGEVGEDCLTLSVWVPATATPDDRMAVMVWVHGGGFQTGGSGIETYDCAELAVTQQLVVVSIQYRLGVFGFGWFRGGAPNLGLRDQLAALEWIRHNAANFGGDPTNITVFGESAGAGSLLHLLSSPAATGLVQRAILQSPGVDHTLLPEDSERVTAAVLDAIDLTAEQSHRLWGLPPAVLVAAQEKAFATLLTTVGSMPYHPVVDGEFLTTKPGVAFAAPDIDLLVSWTADEMRLYPNRSVEAGDGDRLSRWVQRLISKRLREDPGMDRVQVLLEHYRAQGAAVGRTSGADLWAAVQTDALMRLPARRVAWSHSRSRSAERATYTSQFDWQAQGGDWRRGAFHAVDLPFTFSTLSRCGWQPFLGIDDPAAAVALARRHMDAWGSFARTGQPGWAGSDRHRFPTYAFDTEDHLAEDPLADVAEVWEGLWSADGPPPA